MRLAPGPILALLALVAGRALCSAGLVPERLRCVAQVYLRPPAPQADEQLLSGLQVDEFVDRPGRRSSLRVVDRLERSQRFYFNQLPARDDTSERKFVEFRPDLAQCRPVSPLDWPLQQVRWALMALLSGPQMTRALCDLALGPAGLLYALDASLDLFSFRRTQFSPNALAQVDVYEHYNPYDSFVGDHAHALLVVVYVAAGPALANGTERSLAQHVQLAGGLQVRSVGFFRLAGGARPERPTSAQLTMRVDYQLAQPSHQLAAGLLGPELDAAGAFDFEASPFVQPVGVGCFEESLSSSVQKRLEPPGARSEPASVQLSAQFETWPPGRGAGFVALDGRSGSLRLDRGGLKSVYDLSRARSYHRNELLAMREAVRRLDRAQHCLQLPVTDQHLLKLEPLEHLLGLDAAGARPAYYLGSRLVGAERLDVFERELQFSHRLAGYPLPALLEPAHEALPGVDVGERTRYFVTFYASQDKQPVPRFVELWRLERKSAQKRLLSRLTFISFAWSLAVAAAADGSPAALPANPFFLGPCARPRAKQLQLNFRFTQYPGRALQPGAPVDWVRRSVGELGQRLAGAVAERLSLSLLNVGPVELFFGEPASANFRGRLTLVELATGLTDDKLLGYAHLHQLAAWLPGQAIRQLSQVHSLDACRLESLLEPAPNVLAYCPGAALCALLWPTGLDPHLSILASQPSASGAPSSTGVQCELRQSGWAASTADAGRKDAATVESMMFSKYKLVNTNIKLPLPASQAGDKAELRGYLHALTMELRDQAGAAPLLTGLRYAGAAAAAAAAAPGAALEQRLCGAACQLNEACSSYSLCSSPASGASADSQACALGPVRLSQLGVAQVGEQLRQAAAAGQAGFELAATSGGAPASFRLDQHCGLHAKDYLALFEPMRRVRSPSRPVAPADEEANNSSLAGSEGNLLTLQQCAGLAHDLAASGGEQAARFVYCPLNGLCLAGLDELEAARKLAPGAVCELYQASHLSFYHAWRYSRLRLQLPDEAAAQGAKRGAEASAGQLQAAGVARIIEGLDEEACARHCARAASGAGGCLAFDACTPDEADKSQLCALYAIRSPSVARASRRLSLLAAETPFYPAEQASGSAKLVSDMRCSHYALEGDWLELALATSGAAGAAADQTALAEAQQLASEEERGQADISQLLRRPPPRATSGARAWGPAHLLLACAAATLAALSLLQGPRAAHLARNLLHERRARDASRLAQHRLSTLALAEQLEL